MHAKTQEHHTRKGRRDTYIQGYSSGSTVHPRLQWYPPRPQKDASCTPRLVHPHGIGEVCTLSPCEGRVRGTGLVEHSLQGDGKVRQGTRGWEKGTAGENGGIPI